MCSENQGPRAEAEDEGRPLGAAEGSEGRARSPPRRQGHRWCSQQALQDVTLFFFLNFFFGFFWVRIVYTNVRAIRCLMKWGLKCQQGGEAVDSAGSDGDIAEAEGGSEGSLQ